jgi:hypothetical protein
MGDVVRGPFVTTNDTSPDRALEAAAEYGLTAVVIVGRREDGEFFFASSQADSGEVLYYLVKAQHKLMCMEDQIEADGDPRGRPGRGV